MIAYDFDKTVYHGDSTADFYFYCVKKDITLLRYALFQFHGFALYALGFMSKTKAKEIFYKFLRGVRDIDAVVQEFWKFNQHKLKNFYKCRDHSQDIIISASPCFLLTPICQRLGVKLLIASNVDKHTGKYDGLNCYGEEKVRRLMLEIPGCKPDEFYSDSYSDAPLADISVKSYMVFGDDVVEWGQRKPLTKKRQ